jgi:hypothetical protein
MNNQNRLRDEMIAHRLAVAVALSVAGGTVPLSSASAADCPTELQVHESVKKYIYTVDWTPSRQDIYKVKFVGNFKFGPMRVGKTYGSICPIRIEYSYEVVKNDGTMTVTKGGENKTHLFYQDSFGDWIFRVGSNT